MIYRYDETQNPAYRAPTADDPAPAWTPDAIPGVPLRDLTADDLAALPPWLWASVAAFPCYQLVDAAALAALASSTAPADPEPARPRRRGADRAQE